MATIVRDEMTSLGREIEVDVAVDPQCGIDAGVFGSWLHYDNGRSAIRLPFDATQATIDAARAWIVTAVDRSTCPHVAERNRRERMRLAGVSPTDVALVVALVEVYKVLSAGQRSAVDTALPGDLKARLMAIYDRAKTAFTG